MNSCKTLFRASLSSSPFVHLPNPNSSITLVSFRSFSSSSVLRRIPRCALHEAASLPVLDTFAENHPPSDPTVSVKELLTTNRNDASSMMKMERRRCTSTGGDRNRGGSWFPYEDRFRCGDDAHLTSREVLEAVSPHMMEERSDRFRRVVENRSFSVCLVVEGLSDIGNISAAFRSADALGIQSVHVVASDSFKRCPLSEVWHFSVSATLSP